MAIFRHVTAFAVAIVFAQVALAGDVPAKRQPSIKQRTTATNPRLSPPEQMRACFNQEILKFTPVQNFRGPQGRADCPNANNHACMGRNNDQKDISYSADSQWRIVGTPVVVPVTGPNADAGFAGPFVDPGRRSASAVAWCRGGGCGAPGAWAEGYVQGQIQRLATDDEKKQVMGLCFDRVFRNK